MTAYYNEFDKHAAAWLRELIKAGMIPEGEVDERSICEVSAADLAGFTQCHYFAGVGGWPMALRQAGWPDDRPVWTGSCPCQPFSSAGQQRGTSDERHLWPVFFELIKTCRPPVVFGEQVASAAVLGSSSKIKRSVKSVGTEDKGENGRPWLDIVQNDLEGVGYAVGAVDIPAAGFGAPHIRQRLYWVANATGNRRAGTRESGKAKEGWKQRPDKTRVVQSGLEGHRSDDRLADAERNGLETHDKRGQDEPPGIACECGRMGDSYGIGGTSRIPEKVERKERNTKIFNDGNSGLSRSNTGRPNINTDYRPSPTDGFWRNPDWLFCRDNKWRPVESGLTSLVDGLPHRAPLLRGYGNAICLPQAAAFVEAFMEVEKDELRR